MTVSEIAVLSVAAFCTSAITALVGAGGGTALIAVMLQVMSPATAIPVHGAVQLSSNCWRVWLLRGHLSWPIIVRFALLMPAGAAVGLALFQGLPAAAVQMLIGIFVLISLAPRQLARLQDGPLPLWAFVPVGFATGALNMVVGVVAPVLGALMVRQALTKEEVVGTLGVFGLLGNFAKVVGFTLIGFAFADHALTIACMIPTALAGTSAGRFLLARVDEKSFLTAFRVVLAGLAVKLIVYDGLVILLS